MPKELEDKLKKEYADLPEKQRNAAIYGTMRKTGWKPKNQGKGLAEELGKH